jgi:hypothetical protein
MRFGCLGHAFVAQVPSIAPDRPEVNRIWSPAEVAGIVKDLVLLKDVEGITWKEFGVIKPVPKWPLDWINHRGGRIDRFAMAVSAPCHGAVSSVEGFRIILPANEIRRSIRKLRQAIWALNRQVTP